MRGTGPRTTVARAAPLLNRSARACPSHAFSLKQDGQDEQDVQDEGEKVWKTLMSIDASEQQGEKVREDLNLYRPATKKTRPDSRSARACPSHASQQPLHIKVLSDLVILFLLML